MIFEAPFISAVLVLTSASPKSSLFTVRDKDDPQTSRYRIIAYE